MYNKTTRRNSEKDTMKLKHTQARKANRTFVKIDHAQRTWYNTAMYGSRIASQRRNAASKLAKQGKPKNAIMKIIDKLFG